MKGTTNTFELNKYVQTLDYLFDWPVIIMNARLLMYKVYIRGRTLSSYLSRRKVVPIPLYIINMFTCPTLRRTYETDSLIFSFCIKLIWDFLRLQNCFNELYFSLAFK